MSDGQKQVLTVAGILGAAVLLCVLLVGGTFLLTREVTEMADSSDYTFSPEDGVVITAVMPQSPAAAANLQPGHVLLQVNGETITSPAWLSLSLQNLSAGEEFTLLVQDEAGTLRQTTAVRAAEPPYLGASIVGRPVTIPAPTNPSTQAAPLTTQLPVVQAIVPSSPAEAVDIQPGDIITAVDGAAISEFRFPRRGLRIE